MALVYLYILTPERYYYLGYSHYMCGGGEEDMTILKLHENYVSYKGTNGFLTPPPFRTLKGITLIRKYYCQ